MQKNSRFMAAILGATLSFGSLLADGNYLYSIPYLGSFNYKSRKMMAAGDTRLTLGTIPTVLLAGLSLYSARQLVGISAGLAALGLKAADFSKGADLLERAQSNHKSVAKNVGAVLIAALSLYLLKNRAVDVKIYRVQKLLSLATDRTPSAMDEKNGISITRDYQDALVRLVAAEDAQKLIEVLKNYDSSYIPTDLEGNLVDLPELITQLRKECAGLKSSDAYLSVKESERADARLFNQNVLVCCAAALSVFAAGYLSKSLLLAIAKQPRELRLLSEQSENLMIENRLKGLAWAEASRQAEARMQPIRSNYAYNN